MRCISTPDMKVLTRDACKVLDFFESGRGPNGSVLFSETIDGGLIDFKNLRPEGYALNQGMKSYALMRSSWLGFLLSCEEFIRDPVSGEVYNPAKKSLENIIMSVKDVSISNGFLYISGSTETYVFRIQDEPDSETPAKKTSRKSSKAPRKAVYYEVRVNGVTQVTYVSKAKAQALVKSFEATGQPACIVEVRE